MDDKTKARIKKLQALAERGVGGEKTTAEKMLQKMLKKKRNKIARRIGNRQLRIYAILLSWKT